MKLTINNFAKISHAEIEFDGLTVIAGNNNTGKSTAGKILYAIFRALSQLERRVERDRIKTIVKAFNRIPGVLLSEEVAKRLLYKESVVAEVLPTDTDPFFWHSAEKTVADAQAIPFNSVAANLIYRVFDCVFHHQYRPLQPSDGDTRLVLRVKGQENTIDFRRDGSIETHNPTRLVKIVRLIATPEVLSLVNVRDILSNDSYAKVFDKYTLELAQELVKDSRLSAIEEIAAQKELESVIPLLNDFIAGVFRPDSENEYALYESSHDHPTKAVNLSMGLKFFVLLRFMLERGVLSEQDVLILDEPENHLHPELQVVYAQVLVQLQKKFNLTILVTSHSQFFVNALQRFCISEDIVEKTHFYISKEDVEQKGFCTFEDQGSVAADIFRSFNKAYDMISQRSGEAWSDDEVNATVDSE